MDNLLFSERRRFVNEHNGNIILDGVHQLAGLANQAIFRVVQAHRFFALRTGQNIEEFF